MATSASSQAIAKCNRDNDIQMLRAVASMDHLPDAPSGVRGIAFAVHTVRCNYRYTHDEVFRSDRCLLHSISSCCLRSE